MSEGKTTPLIRAKRPALLPAAFLLCALLPACSLVLPDPAELHKMPLVRAERSGFTETTRYRETLEFLHVLEELSDRARVELFGATAEGRPLPLIVLGNPPPAGPDEIDRNRTTVVFILANIHAGEVEGKEASLMLARDIVSGPLSCLLEKTVILVAPDFNADGNERISVENRRWQAGPSGGVGARANAQNLDLNRDFMKIESPEMLSLLTGVILRWDPDLLVDCHTTNGALHKEPICYAPSHSPLGDPDILAFDRDVMLPWVVGETLERDGYPAIPYGFWKNRADPEEGWITFGHEPRYGTNYWGLRNRHSILIEIYAYADFETRVKSCYAFLRSILDFARREGSELRRLVRAADGAAAAGLDRPFHWEFEATAFEKPITIMGYEPTRERRDPKNPGVEKNYTVPFYGCFRPVDAGKPLPEQGWIVRRGSVNVLDKLLQHGIRITEIGRDETTHGLPAVKTEVFTIDEIIPAEHLFQGHWNTRLKGRWRKKNITLEAGDYLVPAKQPLAMLAASLLEPESGDGLAFWNFMDRYITKGTFDSTPAPYPVLRW